MSASNPFQIPSCLQRANLQQRRRNRLRSIVIGSVAFFVVLLVALLIAGCMSQHAKVATTATTERSKPSPGQLTVAQVKPVESSLPTPTAQPSVAPSAPKNSTPPATNPSELTYVVKAGDTLSRIAQQHRLTVKALKAANGLDSDDITIGMKLKLPNA